MYKITDDSYWFFWDAYIQEEYKLTLEIGGLQKQIEEIRNVENIQNELKLKVNQLRTKIDDERHLEALDNFEEDEYYINMYLKDFLLKSNCLSLYAYTEGKLKEICSLVDSLFTNTDNISSKNDRDSIKNHFKHLKNKGLDLSKAELHYQKIVQQRPVRIALAHHNGNLSNIKYFPIWTGLERNGNSIKIKSIEYLNLLLDEINSMFQKILISISIKMRNDS